jgi:uncharacterized membrane protein
MMAFEPTRLRGLIRIDVLQCIGASLVLLNLVTLGLGKRSLIASLIALTVLTGLATAWFRLWVPGPLPEAIAGYLGQWPAPEGKPVLALFPLFPWFGFACAGAALGAHWSGASTASSSTLVEERVVAGVAIGAWMALLTSEAWAPVYVVARDHAWISPLLRLIYKLGLVSILSGFAVLLARQSAWLVAPVQTLGRASLLVYWVHLEFAFGIAARPLVRRLDFPAWALGTAVLIAAMWLVASLRASAFAAQLRWPGVARPRPPAVLPEAASDELT